MAPLRTALFLLSLPLAHAAGPLVRDLGVPVKAVNWVRLHPGRGPDGNPSLLASMGQNNGGLFVLDIDLTSGRCRQFNAPSADEQYPTASFRSPRTGALYIGANTDGHLLRYDPAHPGRGLEDLGAVDGDHFTFPTGIDEAPDGSIWVGAFPNATLSRLDPATGRLTRYGSMDEVDQYLYPLCGHDGTVAALTKVVRPHLVVFDPQTGAHRSVGPVTSPEDKSEHLEFFKGIDGFLYLDTHAGKFRVRGAALEPVAFLPARMPGVDATYKHGYQEVLPRPGGLTAVFADGEEGSGIFRKVLLRSASPVEAPRTLDLDWRGGGSNIFLIHAGPDGLIYGSSFLPEHLFRCAPDGSAMVNLGRCSVSLGETYTIGNFSDGTMALGSYPSARISLYDPRRPYRFGTGPGANPRDIGRLDDVAIRPIAMAVVPPLHAGGGRAVPERMWVGSAPDYGTWGGTLAWLDPATLAHASHRNLVRDCAPYSMLFLPGLRQLLVGLTVEGGTGTKPKVLHGSFVLWDPADDRPVYAGDFGVKNMPDVLGLAPAGGGLVYALLGHTHYTTKFVGGAFGGPVRLALLDPAARRVIADAPLDPALGEMPEQAQFCLFEGPGGVYGMTGRTLYRVKPGTCGTETVWRAPAGDQLDTPGPWIGRTFLFATGWRLRALTLR